MSAVRGLAPADVTFSVDGTPRSERYDDVYHSAAGGVAQACHVFIAGNGLPQAWQEREQFVVLETGFGLGLNFLATWQAWRDDPQRCTRLHFVSVEKHPFTRHDLTQLHQRCLHQSPSLLALAEQLQTQWPVLTPGIHRILLDDGQVTLTLLLGDAATQLRKLSLQANALFLDGFAPSKNPALWEPYFLKAVTRLCAPGATLATWCVSGQVREALRTLRWDLEKRAGFSGKRHMLCGRLYGERAALPTAKRAIVIGAGIAGTAIAERLAARGWHIDLIERHASAANEASGNPVGLLHPMLAKDDNLAARLSRAGYLYALQLLAQLDAEALGLRWDRCGILQLARDAKQENEQRDTTDALGFPDDYVSFVDCAGAAQQARHSVAAGGWFYPAGAIVNPPSLCNALIARHREKIATHFNIEVARLQHDGENWVASDSGNGIIAAAPVVIVANAYDAARLIPHCDLPLSRLRGQVSVLPRGSLAHLPHAICGNGYVTPDTLGAHCIGATFDMDDDGTQPREDSHRFNLERLAELLPAADTSAFDASMLEGRVGFRTMAIDRMPIVGSLIDSTKPLRAGARLRDVPRLSGLYGLFALGSRGLPWGPLLAELLAAQLNNEPLPVERDLLEAIDPGRFAIRTQRRIVSVAQDL